MPYFKWVGVDIAGTKHTGKHAARSSHDLSERLLKREIALIKCAQIYAPSFLWPVNAFEKGYIFQKKAKLLRAGVKLPMALKIVAEQAHNPILYDILTSITDDIEHGIALAKAFEKHPDLNDSMVNVMLAAGYESGNVIDAIENVALYFHKQHLFNKNIRSVLAMPLLTLLFFVGITFFIVTCIIPRFADMFSSLEQELPTLTRYMIYVSDFVSSSSMIYLIFFTLFIIICLYRYFSTIGKNMWGQIIGHIPCINSVLWQYYMCQALQAVSLLVNSGVSLVKSLEIVEKSTENALVNSQLKILHDGVQSGQLLSNAMMTIQNFSPEIIGLIQVGEESGGLGQSIENAALVYTDQVERRLKRFVFILQPLVIVILGLLVMTLIFAIYLPIMQLSHVL